MQCESIYKNIGIIENDIITKINGNEINQVPIDLAENIVNLNENEELTIGLIRNGIKVVLGIDKTDFNEPIFWPKF